MISFEIQRNNILIIITRREVTPSLFKTLGLPVHHKAFGTVMVGYPKLRYQRLPLRNALRVSYL
jgi:hypothetical protein